MLPLPHWCHLLWKVFPGVLCPALPWMDYSLISWLLPLLFCVGPLSSSVPLIPVELTGRQLPENNRERKHLRPCISDETMILPSYFISSFSEYRVVGLKSFFFRNLKASLHFFLASGIEMEKVKDIQIHNLWNGIWFFSPSLEVYLIASFSSIF